MAKYLLIESRDPFDCAEVARDLELAVNLKKADNEVTLYLVQNGVLAARRGAPPGGLDAVLRARVEVYCDEFSLKERGIPPGGLLLGIRPAALDMVVDQLADGRKTIWL